MMSIQDLMKIHVNDECKYCNRKNCNGIRVTQDGRTVCEEQMMRGSRIAYEIEADMKREKYFKQKAIRNRCIIDNKKQCDECKYKEICENVEDK